MSEIIFGKHILNSLSTGMYSDPMTIYREYIQNAADSIDKAVKNGLVDADNAVIHVVVDSIKRRIVIEDNGTGIPQNDVYNRLLDIANSQKDYREDKGFRGIGRLGGLGCSKNLYFVTSFKGENVKSTVKWNGELFLQMLNVDNKAVRTALEVIEASTKVYSEPEDENKHYFHVVMENVFDQFDELVDEKNVDYYLSTVAPVAFDGQKFIHARGIATEYANSGKSIEKYNIYLNKRQKPVYKKYTTNFKTGHQEKNKKEDHIQEIRYFEDVMPDGTLMYKGWYAITNFYGSVSDEYMCGIRIRKGNILIGGENTFSKFFSSEGNVANKWFIGEVHIYNPDVLPNAKRDDFERNIAYEVLKKSLNVKADEINREHRRLMSGYNSAIKKVESNLSKLKQIEERIDSKKVNTTSEREKLLQDKKEVEKKIISDKKELSKIVAKDSLDEKYRKRASQLLSETEQAERKIVKVENKIINTKPVSGGELPTSYSREIRKFYSRVIESIYEFFGDDISSADKIKDKILNDLREKK